MNSKYLENEISGMVIDVCINIHKRYGPGLFESVYEEIFCYEWAKTGIPFERQKPIPVIHEDIKMEIGFRADVILDSKVLLELKSIEKNCRCSSQTSSYIFKINGNKIRIINKFQ